MFTSIPLIVIPHPIFIFLSAVCFAGYLIFIHKHLERVKSILRIDDVNSLKKAKHFRYHYLALAYILAGESVAFYIGAILFATVNIDMSRVFSDPNYYNNITWFAFDLLGVTMFIVVSGIHLLITDQKTLMNWNLVRIAVLVTFFALLWSGVWTGLLIWIDVFSYFSTSASPVMLFMWTLALFIVVDIQQRFSTRTILIHWILLSMKEKAEAVNLSEHESIPEFNTLSNWTAKRLVSYLRYLIHEYLIKNGFTVKIVKKHDKIKRILVFLDKEVLNGWVKEFLLILEEAKNRKLTRFKLLTLLNRCTLTHLQIMAVILLSDNPTVNQLVQEYNLEELLTRRLI